MEDNARHSVLLRANTGPLALAWGFGQPSGALLLLCIPEVLTKKEVEHCRSVMGSSAWVDGNETAGPQAAAVKFNTQLPELSPTCRELGEVVLRALYSTPLFVSAALPLTILPPLFNRYGVGQHFGTHVDGAIRRLPATTTIMRTDLSATLFLSEPDEYDGGELTVEDKYGTHEVKLPAGDMVLYPATSLHHVQPITRGERTASFFWIQSMVRDDGERTLLFELDQAIQDLVVEKGSKADVCVRLTGIYHNLIRRTAEV